MNKVFQSMRIAFRALRVNKLRSALTMLGIIIGVGAVIAMVSVGSGATDRIHQQIAAIGWATSRAVLPRLGPRSATPSSTRPLFVPASLAEPKATEFPPLAVGSLAGAVLPVFLTLSPLESAG